MTINRRKRTNHQCNDHRYGNYDTFQAADTVCASDINCSGVYDPSCDGAPRFYLCRQDYPLEYSSTSCVYRKQTGTYKFYIF